MLIVYVCIILNGTQTLIRINILIMSIHIENTKESTIYSTIQTVSPLSQTTINFLEQLPICHIQGTTHYPLIHIIHITQ